MFSFFEFDWVLRACFRTNRGTDVPGTSNLSPGEAFSKCFSKVAKPSMADSPRSWQKGPSPSLCHQLAASLRTPFASSSARWPVEPAAVQGSGAHTWLQMWTGRWPDEGLRPVTGRDALSCRANNYTRSTVLSGRHVFHSKGVAEGSSVGLRAGASWS